MVDTRPPPGFPDGKVAVTSGAHRSRYSRCSRYISISDLIDVVGISDVIDVVDIPDVIYVVATQ